MYSTIFDELLDIDREMDRVFYGYPQRNRSNFAETNVYENSDGYVIVAKLPGLAKENVGITIEDDTLVISGERKEAEQKDAVIHLIERFSGKFERSFVLNDKIDREKIQAEMKNGLLVIKLPKSPETKPRQIEIK